MIGLSILLAVAAYIWLARFVAKRIENRAAKYLVIALFVLVPTWDIIPGKIYFNNMCEKEAGLKVYKVVERVEGFRYEQGVGGLLRQAIEEYGYKYVEIRDGKQFYRYTLNSNGHVVKQEISEPSARYAVGAERTLLSWNVERNEEFIFDVQTQEKLAIRTTFFRGGNWLQVILPGPHAGDYCSEPLATSKDLYLKTIKPFKSTN